MIRSGYTVCDNKECNALREEKDVWICSFRKLATLKTTNSCRNNSTG